MDFGEHILGLQRREPVVVLPAGGGDGLEPFSGGEGGDEGCHIACDLRVRGGFAFRRKRRGKLIYVFREFERRHAGDVFSVVVDCGFTFIRAVFVLDAVGDFERRGFLVDSEVVFLNFIFRQVARVLGFDASASAAPLNYVTGREFSRSNLIAVH